MPTVYLRELLKDSYHQPYVVLYLWSFSSTFAGEAESLRDIGVKKVKNHSLVFAACGYSSAEPSSETRRNFFFSLAQLMLFENKSEKPPRAF